MQPVPTEFYTLSLHDALPIFPPSSRRMPRLGYSSLCIVCGMAYRAGVAGASGYTGAELLRDRKSTRLNSSHVEISYAVFCLKKKTYRDHHGVFNRKRTRVYRR